MEQNVGVLDQTLRVTLGFALLFVGFLIPEPGKWLAFAGFLAFVVSGYSGRCLLYRLLGLKTG